MQGLKAFCQRIFLSLSESHFSLPCINTGGISNWDSPWRSFTTKDLNHTSIHKQYLCLEIRYRTSRWHSVTKPYPNSKFCNISTGWRVGSLNIKTKLFSPLLNCSSPVQKKWALQWDTPFRRKQSYWNDWCQTASPSDVFLIYVFILFDSEWNHSASPVQSYVLSTNLRQENWVRLLSST